LRRTTKKDGIRTYSSDKELVDSKRKEITNEATKVFVKKGYHQTNMRELATAMGMSIGSIYHYVESKQDILYLIINSAVTRPDAWLQDIAENLRTGSATMVLKEFIRQHYTFVDEQQNTTLFTYQETKNLDRKSQKIIIDAAAKDVEACALILRKGVESGEFKMDNALLMAHNVIVLGHMWAVRRWYLSRICTLDDYIKEQTQLILKRIAVK
jgi:TetR/AcrR family transcriptional regulator, cholesterol catabolism regulator